MERVEIRIQISLTPLLGPAVDGHHKDDPVPRLRKVQEWLWQRGDLSIRC